jgi:uncharacterized protein
VRRGPGALAALVWACVVPIVAASQEVPRLTEPVTDTAGVIAREHAEAMTRRIRALHARTGDAVVVVTTPTVAPFGDIREYAVELFENHGAGIGAKGQDNGVLVLLAVHERRVWIEVGYGLEPYITDGFAGEVSRTVMVPHFRRGDFGAGLAAGVDRLIARLADARHVEIRDLPLQPPATAPGGAAPGSLFLMLMAAFILLQFLSGVNRLRSGRRHGWGRRRTWSGWHSGVGPFGGGFGGGWGSGGGGFGGGFGGFGGGRSGGGGGGAAW